MGRKTKTQVTLDLARTYRRTFERLEKEVAEIALPEPREPAAGVDFVDAAEHWEGERGLWEEIHRTLSFAQQAVRRFLNTKLMPLCAAASGHEVRCRNERQQAQRREDERLAAIEAEKNRPLTGEEQQALLSRVAQLEAKVAADGTDA